MDLLTVLPDGGHRVTGEPTFSVDQARKSVYQRAGGQCEMQVLIEEKNGPTSRWYPERCPTETADWSHRWGRGTGGLWSPANGLHLCRPCHRWLHASPDRARAGGWALTSESDPAAEPVWLPAPFPARWLLDDNPPDDGAHVLRLVSYLPPEVELRRVVPASWAA